MLPASLARARPAPTSPKPLRRCPKPPPPATKAAFAAALSAHSDPSRLRQLHALLLTAGLSRKEGLLARLLISLCSAGHLPYARRLLCSPADPPRRPFLWNTLIRAYAALSLPAHALALLRRIRRLSLRPDPFTFPPALRACADLLDAPSGAAAHALLLRLGLLLRHSVAATELVLMYAKLGDLGSAELVFQELGDSHGKDLILWNALVSALAQNGRAERALEYFKQMESEGVRPDAITFVGAVSSCAYLGCLELGTRIHRRITEEIPDPNVIVRNAVVDMYAKCGCVEKARELFDEMPQRNVVSWSTMIGGYAINGDSRSAMSLFDEMCQRGVEPNHISFLAVLTACSHAGLVDEGKKYFYSMVDPRIEHYATMVDLLGRSGHLYEAYQFIETMPIEPDAGVWGALLGACTIYGNTEIGQVAADRVLALAPEIPSYHVLLSNMYAASKRWSDVEKVREKMRESKVKKVGGYSSVELEGKVYIFYEGSKSWSKDIYKKLEEITTLVREFGYEPMAGVVLHDVEAEEKEVAVGTHSEKLAIAFSLLRLEGSKSSLRIIKNLRICRDCHEFSKRASKALRREIVIRDKSRFHHFRDGECSCNDFW